MGSKGDRVVVVGAGIGGLTTAALLAHRGYQVLVLDQALVPGGCASTFKRRGFTFDVGATQVAGLEPGGIHHRIFSELEIEPPEATPCDPACAVLLPGETEPIHVWRDPDQWRAERQRQFPGSKPFWQLLADLFRYSWAFQGRDPILPPRNIWDFWQLTKAVRPDTLLTLPHTFSTVGDALRGYRLADNLRLRTFLDLQLKLYSQVDAENTALLYAATALGVSQAPHGLFHLQGSMQVLSDRLVQALERDGGRLLMRHSVEQIHVEAGVVKAVTIHNQKTNDVWTEPADQVVANVTVQNLVPLLGEAIPSGYQQRVDKLPQASGAFVIYLGVDQSAIPEGCPPHLQFLYDYDGPIGENNSLFVSVSHPGDGRAPEGQATIVASSFTDPTLWWQCPNYERLKQQYTETAIARLGQFFHLTPENILHQESATPRTFAHYTGREQGIVGGIGQRVSTFGPFGFANRTPIQKLWLVGDSTHPGEGTAGVSYSALTVVRQIEANSEKGRP
ncbi:C-3',4' desaturase CrtD [Trichocoleus sp. FACHB-262]|uniref:C-3',4' desaturase CrtD n=1 Tax=Trichocoleus sp. FACHB-262 TaxID=2692869 RepID=UPI00168647C2|nr:C-3',4' desaturase CrtD [Trichocoleus sp. FACHB-262]MBD2119940.1 C-3',4' desaturase CrtD [Trichocoleus sp. FACHB-262]